MVFLNHSVHGGSDKHVTPRKKTEKKVKKVKNMHNAEYASVQFRNVDSEDQWQECCLLLFKLSLLLHILPASMWVCAVLIGFILLPVRLGDPSLPLGWSCDPLGK